MMKKLCTISMLLLSAPLGGLLLLAHSLAWRAVGEALGLGTIQVGVPVLGRVLLWSGVEGLPMLLWWQLHTPPGFLDALAGVLLGYASGLAYLHRQDGVARGDRAREKCNCVVSIIAWPVGVWGAMMMCGVIIPGFLALASHPNAREFWLQQFLLTGLLLNPKLWWCAALPRYICRALDGALK